VSTPAKDVNLFHQKDDLDSSHRAHHHTLGQGVHQAAPGNHTHDGVDSPEIPIYFLTQIELYPSGPGDISGSFILKPTGTSTNISAYLNGIKDTQAWSANLFTGEFDWADPLNELVDGDIIAVDYVTAGEYY